MHALFVLLLSFFGHAGAAPHVSTLATSASPAYKSCIPDDSAPGLKFICPK